MPERRILADVAARALSDSDLAAVPDAIRASAFLRELQGQVERLLADKSLSRAQVHEGLCALHRQMSRRQREVAVEFYLLRLAGLRLTFPPDTKETAHAHA